MRIGADAVSRAAKEKPIAGFEPSYCSEQRYHRFPAAKLARQMDHARIELALNGHKLVVRVGLKPTVKNL